MYLLFDIGATKTRLAYSPDGNTFEEPLIFSTINNYKEGYEALKLRIDKLLNGRELIAIVGGVAGRVDLSTGKISRARRLGWGDSPFGNDLSNDYNVKVLVHNDAAMAALGEALHGAGRGYDDVVYITISTGVNGAKVSKGKLHPPHKMLSVGRHIISRNEDGSNLCYEDAVSGLSLEKRYGAEPKNITDLNVWKKVCSYLAIGVMNASLFWAPDVIVLGGGVLNTKNLSVKKIEKELVNISEGRTIPAIAAAELHDVGGLWGALEYVKQKYDL